MAGKRALVVTTVAGDESSLRELIADADEIRVVAPAADVSFLQWLTNDETVRAALDAHGIPVRHRELSSTG